MNLGPRGARATRPSCVGGPGGGYSPMCNTLHASPYRRLASQWKLAHNTSLHWRSICKKLVRKLEEIMVWEAPAFEEICLACEINSYANAE
jgi:coenzyme PQQ precursor peptide PqqA